MPEETLPLLHMEGVHFSYTTDPLIHDIDFSINRKETICIVGENGSGKSTLLKLMIGELTPDQGQVYLKGQDLRTCTDFSSLGYMPQANVISKISFPVTCEEMLSLTAYEDMGPFKFPRARHYQAAQEALDRFGLGHCMKVPFQELSGGMQQRVMVARAMMTKPDLLVLDEPTAGVDQDHKIGLFNLLNKLKHETEIAYIIVTHELELTREYLDLDHLYRIQEGALIHA